MGCPKLGHGRFAGRSRSREHASEWLYDAVHSDEAVSRVTSEQSPRRHGPASLAASFRTSPRVGFVNSIARICRQIQRSGGGARPPRQRAGHRRQTAVAAVCATERRRRQARQRHLGSSDPVPQTNGTARGRPSPATRALSLFRPRWSDRSARDGRLFAARERDIASKVAAGARSTAIVIARFPPGVHSRSPARPTPFARASTGRPSTSWSTGEA